MVKFFKLAMPRRYSDIFSNFLQILRSRNRELKTTYNTFQCCHVHL